jgi:hypothetical protein
VAITVHALGRTKLKAEEKALEAEFRAAWSDVLAGKGLLDHCQDKKVYVHALTDGGQ